MRAPLNATLLDRIPQCSTPGCPVTHAFRLACPRGHDHGLSAIYIQNTGVVVLWCLVCQAEACRLALARDYDLDWVDELELVGGAA